jgi:hypothetical protein
MSCHKRHLRHLIVAHDVGAVHVAAELTLVTHLHSNTRNCDPIGAVGHPLVFRCDLLFQSVESKTLGLSSLVSSPFVVVIVVGPRIATRARPNLGDFFHISFVKIR